MEGKQYQTTDNIEIKNQYILEEKTAIPNPGVKMYSYWTGDYRALNQSPHSLWLPLVIY